MKTELYKRFDEAFLQIKISGSKLKDIFIKTYIFICVLILFIIIFFYAE